MNINLKLFCKGLYFLIKSWRLQNPFLSVSFLPAHQNAWWPLGACLFLSNWYSLFHVLWQQVSVHTLAFTKPRLRPVTGIWGSSSTSLVGPSLGNLNDVFARQAGNTCMCKGHVLWSVASLHCLRQNNAWICSSVCFGCSFLHSVLGLKRYNFVLQTEDIRLEPDLYETCKNDIKNYCQNVPYGNAQVTGLGFFSLYFTHSWFFEKDIHNGSRQLSFANSLP